MQRRNPTSHDSPTDRDAWDGSDPDSNPDSVDTSGDWLWARSRPTSLDSQDLPAIVRDVLDRADWQVMPTHGDRAEARHAMIEVRAESRHDRNSVLAGRR